jgi:integrase
MALFKRGGIWWYKFYFAGQPIRESSKSSSKPVAENAEQQRRRELEAGFHNVKEVRQQRIRRLSEIVDEYLVGYRLRYRSATFAEYALGHVSRLIGAEMVVDIDEAAVLRYQEERLREKAALKSINEEVRFLLKMLGDSGEIIRGRLRKKKQLKLAVRKRFGKAFDTEETENLTAKARTSRSPHMYPAFMLARNAGLRNTEIKTLTWGQVNLKTKSLQVWRSKSDAGEGRVVPLNSDLLVVSYPATADVLRELGREGRGAERARLPTAAASLAGCRWGIEGACSAGEQTSLGQHAARRLTVFVSRFPYQTSA